MTGSVPPKLPFGIIGCGGAAVPVAQALAGSAVARLAAVHDRDLALARDLGQQHGVPCAEALDDLLADPAVAAVYIAVPHDQLAPLARRALEAGKHALVEKPLALSLADADALIALAEARGLALGVFYEMRHTTAHQQARALVRGGALGTLTAVRLQTVIDKAPAYYQRGLSGRSLNGWRASQARAGGGVVLMNTSHGLDALRYITGLEVVRLAAETGTWMPGVEVEDTAAATLRFDNGAIGSLLAGAHLAGGGDEAADLFGTLGQLRLPDAYGQGPLQVYLRQPWGDLTAGVWHTLPQTPVNAYALALDDFARAVQHGQPAPTSGRDARAILAIILALYESAATGHVIQLAHAQEVNHARS
jgi:UDP-N-acetyl-2-amino-2-deoxyglucuronate dehydrogenase